MQQNTFFLLKYIAQIFFNHTLSLDLIKGSLGNFESLNSTSPVIVLRKVKLLMYVCTTSTVSLELKVDTELRLLYIRLQKIIPLFFQIGRGSKLVKIWST